MHDRIKLLNEHPELPEDGVNILGEIPANFADRIRAKKNKSY